MREGGGGGQRQRHREKKTNSEQSHALPKVGRVPGPLLDLFMVALLC